MHRAASRRSSAAASPLMPNTLAAKKGATRAAFSMVITLLDPQFLQLSTDIDN